MALYRNGKAKDLDWGGGRILKFVKRPWEEKEDRRRVFKGGARPAAGLCDKCDIYGRESSWQRSQCVKFSLSCG